MQSLTIQPQEISTFPGIENHTTPKQYPTSRQPGYLEKTLVWWAIKARLVYLAFLVLRNPVLIWKTLHGFLKVRGAVWAGNLRKIYRVNGRYYFNQYTPGWPSPAYDELIKSELKRYADPVHVPERLSFVFLAITRKCPMRCEHCFEWDNLNQREVLTKEILMKTIDLYQREGVLQFHFSGGEPMVRFKDLLDLVRFASKKSECWVLTSGFNMTRENALLLRENGCKGVVVSIDHFLPDEHNRFRGNTKAFSSATQAIQEVRRAGMVASLSLCATRRFLEDGHLMRYLDFARELGVQFVQVLEPKNIGHYENADVLLEKKHIDYLEETFRLINHTPAFKDYPTMLYHGYHQRRVGCFSGSRSVYIDSIGDVHACPFCHTRSYNVIEHFQSGDAAIPVKTNQCPRYESIA